MSITCDFMYIIKFNRWANSAEKKKKKTCSMLVYAFKLINLKTLQNQEKIKPSKQEILFFLNAMERRLVASEMKKK